MVTSTKQPDKKVVTMSDHNSAAVVPQRTLLGEVNEHITCPLCRGYYIDATTIVECLHSFCRSCIIKHLQVKSYCPVCEMMINSAKPNIKLDKALQDIVYKLVPGLFQKEMERRQQFYASRPGPAATATPEQRGEDTERIIFSPEDVISFSLEYADATDTDSISSKSSDSNEPQMASVPNRRYLQCPAVVNISHLKKFLSMKFDIDSSQFAIDILYKRVPLPDYYTLMDIAYIYTWKRNEPMRFFYQIIDYVAIRNRLFEINRKGPGFRDRKASFATTEDTNASSPAPQITDQASEASSGTDSPMPDENLKQAIDNTKKVDITSQSNETEKRNDEPKCSSPKNNDEDVEKSQFLNSFELTAKSNCLPVKSPVKSTPEEVTAPVTLPMKTEANTSKVDDKLIEPPKRKFQAPPQAPELKKLKIELEKAKITNFVNNPSTVNQNKKPSEFAKAKEPESAAKNSQPLAAIPNIHTPAALPAKDAKPPISKHQDTPALKRTGPGPQTIMSPKRKPPEAHHSMHMPHGNSKPQSPKKINVPKSEGQSSAMKTPEVPKPPIKKMPDLKPGIPMSQSSQNKGHPINKVRMDLLANNSDPTIDRSKILSQVKTSLSTTTTGSQSSGDQLKSLFDSCKINIPSSLSITLTDQKLDPKNPGETCNQDNKKPMVNKNFVGVSNTAHKVPSPPVHNYIEILKLPDSDPKKINKTEGGAEAKSNVSNKVDASAAPLKQPSKSSESSAKGPVPNLKPISDTKLAKQQSGNFPAPITFQQTFEQQIQTLQTDKKSKVPKNKTQVPKLVPATPKSISAANKSNNLINKLTPQTMPSTENKTGAALDLSTPHNAQNIGQQQTFYKAFETMQSIDNLAKKHNLPAKGLPTSMSTSMHHNTVFPGRPMNTGISPLRIPSTNTMNQIKHDKGGPSSAQTNNMQDINSKMNVSKTGNSSAMTSTAYQMSSHASPNMTQPSPRQTRSPSSSPKLVIAEEKQINHPGPEQNMNQSNQITSSQISSMKSNASELAKPSPGLLKPALKPLPSVGKLTSGIRQPITPSLKSNPAMSFPTDYLMPSARPQLMPHHPALLRQQMELFSRQFDIYKNMTNLAHQSQHDFNNKDKQ